eukprot:3931793-Rhodomonas_salina.1
MSKNQWTPTGILWLLGPENELFEDLGRHSTDRTRVPGTPCMGRRDFLNKNLTVTFTASSGTSTTTSVSRPGPTWLCSSTGISVRGTTIAGTRKS